MIDWFLSTLGEMLGYATPAIIILLVAFIITKLTKKNTTYKIAIPIIVILYAMSFAGNNYVK